MYTPHPSCQLNEAFIKKPYQGVAPEDAKFLFIGLDANYNGKLEIMPIFPKILEYHDDGVAFWQKYGVHHPFLLLGYKGAGKYYHKNFAKFGFRPEHAGAVSFVELLHVPSVGRNKLEVSDLNMVHLERVNNAILNGKTEFIFISAGVARLMLFTGSFPWMTKQIIGTDGPLGFYYRTNIKTIYSHLHFSVYGKFEEQKQKEADFIRGLI